jgi:hypothetical protein
MTADRHRRQAFDQVLDAIEQLVGTDVIRDIAAAAAAELWSREAPDGSALASTYELSQRVEAAAKSLTGAKFELFEAEYADLMGPEPLPPDGVAWFDPAWDPEVGR